MDLEPIKFKEKCPTGAAVFRRLTTNSCIATAVLTSVCRVSALLCLPTFTIMMTTGSRKFFNFSRVNFKNVDSSGNDLVKPCYDLFINGLSHFRKFSADLKLTQGSWMWVSEVLNMFTTFLRSSYVVNTRLLLYFEPDSL